MVARSAPGAPRRLPVVTLSQGLPLPLRLRVVLARTMTRAAVQESAEPRVKQVMLEAPAGSRLPPRQVRAVVPETGRSADGAAPLVLPVLPAEAGALLALPVLPVHRRS